MFFSKIPGMRRVGKEIFLRREYHEARFHLHEIREIRFEDELGQVFQPGDLPVRDAVIVFYLKSGRKKKCFVRKLTQRRYRWLMELLAEE